MMDSAEKALHSVVTRIEKVYANLPYDMQEATLASMLREALAPVSIKTPNRLPVVGRFLPQRYNVVFVGFGTLMFYTIGDTLAIKFTTNTGIVTKAQGFTRCKELLGRLSTSLKGLS